MKNPAGDTEVQIRQAGLQLLLLAQLGNAFQAVADGTSNGQASSSDKQTSSAVYTNAHEGMLEDFAFVPPVPCRHHQPFTRRKFGCTCTCFSWNHERCLAAFVAAYPGNSPLFCSIAPPPPLIPHPQPPLCALPL